LQLWILNKDENGIEPTKKTLGKEHENSLLRILQHTHALIVEKTTQ